MKLPDHVEKIRALIYKAFDNQFARLGIEAKEVLPATFVAADMQTNRVRIESIVDNHRGETGSYAAAREKALEELTFTLFNRLAAIKVMEAHTLFPEVLTKRAEHGDRSFGHKAWLEESPAQRTAEYEGFREYLKFAFNELGTEINLYQADYPYALLPLAVELNEIVAAFNALEKDPEQGAEVWKSDDILGWMYESYNNYKKAAFKESKAKTEWDKVSLQSQWYTPRWVVKFLVDNSLGKLYLEMFPDSEIKNKYAIANAPTTRTREPKSIKEIKLIDPAPGSGNFLLYAFDLFYDLYLDQIEMGRLDVEEKDIPQLIIENNLHGVDLDDRAVQLAQLGLLIKAKRRNRAAHITHFNVVSSDFYLPEFKEALPMFEAEGKLEQAYHDLLKEIWDDLRQAHRFGSLVTIEKKVNDRILKLEQAQNSIPLLFDQMEINVYSNFRNEFFPKLIAAVSRFSSGNEKAFIKGKTLDAILYIEVLSQSFDIAVANPPYTDSGDFGPELKTFLDSNYRQGFKFNSNLYATFIKRSFDLISMGGKMALVHPPTFMYIKSFEDVRNFIINKTYISLFVEWGYLGMFNPAARVDSAMYVLEKEPKENQSLFMKLSDVYEGRRHEAFEKAFGAIMSNHTCEYNYSISQNRLKIIESWPFIFWISDELRAKFQEGVVGKIAHVAEGCKTANNFKFLRYWWEIGDKGNEISALWPNYAKGGPFRKWSGNLWLRLNWGKNGQVFKLDKKASPNNEEFYFLEGITFTGAGSKGTSFRYLPVGSIFDTGSRSIFPKGDVSTHALLGVLNSKLSLYILGCLNPTVNTTVGDIRRLPFPSLIPSIQKQIASLSRKAIAVRDRLHSFKLTDNHFKKNPLEYFSDINLSDRLISFVDHENRECAYILLIESIIDEIIFDNYSLSSHDRKQVEEKVGISVGALPVVPVAKARFLQTLENEPEGVISFVNNLEVRDFSTETQTSLIREFVAIYNGNNGLEDFCIRHQINPINVWYWFEEAKILPTSYAHEIAMEFVAVMIRDLLIEDEDGIIPLVNQAGEEQLLSRIEKRFHQNGFSGAHFAQLASLLGRDLDDYLLGNLFKNMSDHLNYFQYLPKTPFIWHLSSGPAHGFEAYIIIYKWSKDKLYTLKSHYLAQREQALRNRSLTLTEDKSAAGQLEKETIEVQLREIDTFRAKIDALLTQGYDPKLDDGVGKNIAPLQAKGMIPYAVLNPGQLEKYLNADW